MTFFLSSCFLPLLYFTFNRAKNLFWLYLVFKGKGRVRIYEVNVLIILFSSTMLIWMSLLSLLSCPFFLSKHIRHNYNWIIKWQVNHMLRPSHPTTFLFLIIHIIYCINFFLRCVHFFCCISCLFQLLSIKQQQYHTIKKIQYITI